MPVLHSAREPFDPLSEHFDGHDVLCDIARAAAGDAVLGGIAFVVVQSVDAVPEKGTLARSLDRCRGRATVVASGRDQHTDLFARECPYVPASECAAPVRDDDVVRGAVCAASRVGASTPARAAAAARIPAGKVIRSSAGRLTALALAVVMIEPQAVALMHACDREAPERGADAQ